ncbi:MAG: hypothetical protein K1W10_14425 [Lachnospiraceae bacterium]
MIRFCDWEEIDRENVLLNHDEEYFLLEDSVWSKIKKAISKDKNPRKIPVMSKDGDMIGFAYQDDDANRELRMLQELLAEVDALGFKDIYPEYDSVTIYGLNELAWEFAGYLKKQGIVVNVEGVLWSKMGCQEKQVGLDDYSYPVYAEGAWPKSKNKLINKLRSVSFCFECIDKIYEENIRIGKIKDTEEDFFAVLERIKGKDIVLTGTFDIENVYDLFSKCGIDISCFCTQETECDRRILGKPVLGRTEILYRYKSPVFVECDRRNSAWEQISDEFYYLGFERNREFFMIKDYIDIPNNMLCNALFGKRIILLGDVDYCNKLYRYMTDNSDLTEIFYCDIMQENQAECLTSKIDVSNIEKDDICCLMLPSLIEANRVVKNEQKKKAYFDKLMQYGINNYTDYFMRWNILIQLEENPIKYREDYQPLGVCIGAILGHSGNSLIRDILDGHPNIILMEYTWLNQNLFFVCIKLSGKLGSEIGAAFEQLYNDTAVEMKGIIFDRTRFIEKLEMLLEANRTYTSQELFILFHLAEVAMHGNEITNIHETLIYWEPHFIPISDCIDYAKWLGDEKINVTLFNMVRDSKRRGGSGLKEFEKLEGLEKRGMKNFYSVFDLPMEDEQEDFKNYNRVEIKFEDLKSDPKKILCDLCQSLDIVWSDNLLLTTRQGKVNSYMGISGFDLKPVYYNYEEYFSEYDRMRIDLITAPWRKRHGYSYVSCLDYTMLELQEIFLKDFRFEEKMVFDSEEERLKLKWRVTLWERRLLRKCRKNQLLEKWKNS